MGTRPLYEESNKTVAPGVGHSREEHGEKGGHYERSKHAIPEAKGVVGGGYLEYIYTS